MSSIKRRQFLQSLGASLTIVGINQLGIQQAAWNYGKVIAQDTRRKRALLVGINEYPGTSDEDFKKRGLWYRLKGAVTDVELQRELLIHRFGFHPDDVLVLPDRQATRQNILENFKQHLIQWVKSPDDVVVFHYSGHGSNVIDPNQVFTDKLNGTIVPFDADLPPGYPNNGGEVNDITAGTIFLLRSALGRKTKNVTFILDSCYAGGGVRGNLIIRSRPGHVELRGDTQTTQLESSQEELDYQQRWLKDLDISKEKWIEGRRKNLVNGAAIFAAQRNQEAADVTFAPDVHAGVFTYALTRQLWQLTSNQAMGKVVIAAAAKTEQFLKTGQNSRGQKPGIEVKSDSTDDQQPMYFAPMQKPAAEAVITEVKGNAVKLLLTGAEPQVIEALGKGAIFTVVDDRGQTQGTVKIESRDRLNATGLLQTNSAAKIAPGTALQEQVRVIPSNLKLKIGLDKSLDSEASKQALQALPRIEVVPLLEQEVHYILGKMLPAYRQDLEKRAIADLPPVNSIGLFSVGLEPIPGSFDVADESIDAAVNRLQTKFKLLLAARLIKLTLNTSSSRLNVVASLTTANTQSLLAESFTVRGGKSQSPRIPPTVKSQTQSIAQIEIDKPVQISVKNREERDLHIGVLIFSPDGDIDILFPLSDGKNAALVSAGETLQIPNEAQIQKGVQLLFTKPLGIVEVLIVASTAPIDKALKPLQALIMEHKNEKRTASEVAQKAEDAIASLLDDLASGTRGETKKNIRQFDVQQMAALSMTFEIIG
ncbi:MULTISPECIES: caspase family protein [Calothrix]|uniref:Caspase family protein n=2 Tax=Calothrix TaxID=1186 RepID=A0ABR8AHZ1_9CYAN|nr:MULTISPECIES: caspase family protein [Calothrix]MBD2198581.1 caspase family protein [Calothrix parietina FACHB-288]MBD2226964.1 caspase family protein [Calothrix anomala FACHB-343]